MIQFIIFYINLYLFKFAFSDTNFIFFSSFLEDSFSIQINSKAYTIIYNYFVDYYILLIFFFVSIVLSIILFILSYIFGTSLVIFDIEKLSSYECGFSPIDNSRKIIDLKFYKTAILFLIFDIEIIFLFPWSLVVLNNSMLNLNYLLYSIPFLITLLFGILIEYKDKLFEW